jgi:hypothetical protein
MGMRNSPSATPVAEEVIDQNPYGGARVALGTSVGAIKAISDLEE